MTETPRVSQRVGAGEEEGEQLTHPVELFRFLHPHRGKGEVWMDRLSWRDLGASTHRTPRAGSGEPEDYILSVICDATPFQGLLGSATSVQASRPVAVNVYIFGLGSVGHVTETPILEVETHHEAAEAEEPKPVAAVRQLCEWLNLPEAGVADIADFAVRSVANWRAGRRPYPATVRRLYQIHAFVRSLVKSIGGDRARLWMNEPHVPGGTKRIELLKTDEGLAALMDETADLIFERPRKTASPEAEFEEEQVERLFRQPPDPELMRLSPPDDADEAE